MLKQFVFYLLYCMLFFRVALAQPGNDSLPSGKQTTNPAIFTPDRHNTLNCTSCTFYPFIKKMETNTDWSINKKGGCHPATTLVYVSELF